MPTEIVWTALPRERDGSHLRLSVHVSPRLTTPGGADGVLGDFPEMASWPPKDAAFRVVVDGTTPYPARIVSSDPDPILWGALFPKDLRVVSHTTPNHSQTPIHSYPITKIAAWLKEQYAKVAIDSGEDHPTIDDLLADGWDAIRFSGAEGARIWRETTNHLRERLDRQKAVDTRQPSTPTFDFVQLEDFFAPVDVSTREAEEAFTAPVSLPTLDVHTVMQYVSQHPPLLRRLGLVYDLEVDDSTTPIANGTHTIEVKPDIPSLAALTHRVPRTHAHVMGSRFLATPRPAITHLADGYLRLEDTAQFQVLQVEADGGGLKAVDQAGNLQSIKDHPTEDSPDTAPLPSLRADGIAVARVGAAALLHAQLVLGQQLESDLQADNLDLYAEDLVRGLRADVWDDEAGRWYSLMQRVGYYAIEGGTTVIPVEDEGFIVANASKKPLDDDLYASEEVFHWDGWSLVAPRPSLALNTDPADPNPLMDRRNEPGDEIDAVFHFDATPGTLPRLRYGWNYRLRARTVDIAGNSLPPDDGDATHATPPIRYGRFEPTQTPPVLLRTPRGPGESMDTVALRSNFDVPPTPDTAQRHLVPPKVGQLAVELHGELDAQDQAGNLVLDKGAYQVLVDRDAATLANHPAAEVDPADNGDSRYYDVDEVEVTWSPDPVVSALAFRLLDGPEAGWLDTLPLLHPQGSGAWPDYSAIRLQVVEGQGPPSFDATDRVLTVPLRKGDVVHARLSGVIDPAMLDSLGLWGWVLDALPPGPAGDAAKAQLVDLVRAGQHWMFEPYRRLTLVHATRQPVARPEFPNGLQTGRPVGATFVDLSGPMTFHRRSTERVDLLADWEDPVDDGPDSPDEPAFVGDPAGTRIVQGQTAVVMQINQGDAQPESQLEIRERHEVGDTRHHVVTYRGVASSRFTEYFTSRDSITFDGPDDVVVLDTGSPPAGVLPGSVKLSHVQEVEENGETRNQVVALVEGRDFQVSPEDGQVAFLEGEDAELPDPGTELRVAYLVPPFTRETSDPPSEPGEFGPVTVSVPSSLRPTAPRVRYVVPAFRWESSDVTENGQLVERTSTRHGRLLRVYLDRPWWSSGVGELLGVVTWPTAEQGLLELDEEDPLRPYVSQWGEDPIFGQPAMFPRYPRLADLPRAVDTATGLRLSELPGPGAPVVNVAGHDVGFDATRNLWYADLELDTGDAYTPFARLALARWQPDSIQGQELSPVVLADFVQLAPDRSATVVFDDAERSILGVTLTGPTHTGTSIDAAHPGAAQVIVEKRRQDLTGDLGWQEVGQPIVMSGSVNPDGIGAWFAEVHLDEEPAPGQVRLVVEQFERLAQERDTKPPPLANPSIAVQPTPVDRLVFTDIIPL